MPFAEGQEAKHYCQRGGIRDQMRPTPMEHRAENDPAEANDIPRNQTELSWPTSRHHADEVNGIHGDEQDSDFGELVGAVSLHGIPYCGLRHGSASDP